VLVTGQALKALTHACLSQLYLTASDVMIKVFKEGHNQKLLS
jgi:hypothetical protein